MSETCKIKGRKILGQQKQGKKEKKRKNCSSVFNKNDGKVKNYYFTTNLK